MTFFRQTLTAAVLAFAAAFAAFSQTPAQNTPPPPPSAAAQPQDSKLTAEQQKQLQGDVASILEFASSDTALPIKKSVKMRLISRDAVERDLMKKMKDDKGAKKLERSELVLKKFGLLDASFQLQPFLVQLLKEQIAGYYDDKTKTITLLDWVDPADQQPVLAHELTHALQDQHINLRKFEEEDDDDKPSKDVKEDNRRLATDERDTTRDAVVEGQAMIPLIDYALRDQKVTILDAPQAVEMLVGQMASSSDSPVMARAPLLLQESLLFPYREGLEFEVAVLKARGKQGAFAGVLDSPPEVTAQIMHPAEYLKGEPYPHVQMPNVHPLLDPGYEPYDLGAMGEFDVKILLDLFASGKTSAALTPAWRGGVYYAGQRRSDLHTPAENEPRSIALMYSSEWATPEAAKKFAEVYRSLVAHKYDLLKPARADGELGNSGIQETAYESGQGFVLISVSGTSVFTSEGFTADEARKLEVMFFATSSVGAQHAEALPELSAPLRHLFTHSGVLREALSAGTR